MNIKKLLMMLVLGPLIPIIGIPEGDSIDETDGSGNEGEDKNEEPGESTETNKLEEQDKNVTNYSKDDVERIVQKRLTRDRKEQQKVFDRKLEAEKLTETEKANLERDNAKKDAEIAINSANSMLIKAQVTLESTRMNIVDPDAAFALMNMEDVEVKDGKVLGVENALKELINEKKYLVKSSSSEEEDKNIGDNQSGSTKKSSFSMNSLIRKAAGRN